MPKTTFHRNNHKYPAPRWFRKLKKGILGLTMAANAMVQSWGLSDPLLVARIQLWCTVGIVSILEFFEIMLSNGEYYAERVELQDEEAVKRKGPSRTSLMIIVAVAIVLGLAGCMNSKKAVDYLKSKQVLDDTCAANFPVLPVSSDSTGYNESKRRADSLLQVLQEDRENFMREIDQLQELVYEMKADSTVPCDTLNEALFRLLAAQKKENTAIKAHVTELQKMVANIKPVIQKVRDTAAEQVLRDEIKRLNQLLAKCAEVEKELAERKARDSGKVIIRIPWWWILIAAGIGAVAWKFWPIMRGAKSLIKF